MVDEGHEVIVNKVLANTTAGVAAGIACQRVACVRVVLCVECCVIIVAHDPALI